MNAARIAEALRLIADAIEGEAIAPSYYDQKTSPLGRRRHLELVRSGRFPSVKEGRRVMVKADLIDSYLESKTAVRVTVADDVDTEAERLLERMRRSA